MLRIRKFVHLLIKPMLALALIPVSVVVPVVTMTGCSANQQAQVLQYANAFLAAAQAVYNADPNATYAPDLLKAIDSLKTAIANYNASSTSCALISTANTIAQILNSVAPGSSIAGIATIAVAGFDVLISALAPCAPTAAANVARANNIRPTIDYRSEVLRLEQHRNLGTFKSDINNAAKKAGLAKVF